MASFNPPKKGVGFVMYVGLRSQADSRLFQVNPTLAAGDVKVSKDGGALANVATLPVVIGAGAVVKLELSAGEMNADNVAVLFSDVAGGQWCDLMVNLQTAGRQFDELASQASVDAVNNFVDTEVAAIKAKTDNLPASPAAVGSAMTLAPDAVNSTSLAASAVAEIQAGLATAAALDAVDNFVDTEVAAILAAVDTEVGAIKAKTDNLPASPAAVGSAMALAAGAITEAALSSGGLNAIADAILKRDLSAVSGEAGRSVLNALRFLRNRWTAVGNTLSVMKEDDATVAWTATITKDAGADPITGSDPN